MSGLLWPELEEADQQAGWLPEVPVSTHQVVEAIGRRHPMDGYNGEPGRWVFFREVPAATGSYGDVQRFDAVAIGLVPSVDYARVVYEVKVSRSDWLRELKPIPDVRASYNGHPFRRVSAGDARRIATRIAKGDDPSDTRWYQYQVVGEYRKWDAALEVSTEFWIAAPPRVVQLDELPPEAGYLEVRPWGKAGELRAKVVRTAPVRDTPQPDQAFWAGLLRRAAGMRTPEAAS